MSLRQRVEAAQARDRRRLAALLDEQGAVTVVFNGAGPAEGRARGLGGAGDEAIAHAAALAADGAARAQARVQARRRAADWR